MTPPLTVGRIVHYYAAHPPRRPAQPIAALCIAVDAERATAELELFPPTSGGLCVLGSVTVGLDAGRQYDGSRWEWPPRA